TRCSIGCGKTQRRRRFDGQTTLECEPVSLVRIAMNGSWQISRRKMLKGMGVVMGLPLLEAMKPFSILAGPAAAATRKHPVRMAFLYMANGVNPQTWTPKGTGFDFELSEAL